LVLWLTCGALLSGIISMRHERLLDSDVPQFGVGRYLFNMSAFFSGKVLELLESVAETDEVRTNLELPLYECQLLDSIKTVELMVRIEDEFGLKVSPAEFERESWGTPRKIIADLERRAQVNV
jgi:D-alanine--poly(phosphoribitol) ligase subunit 2